MTTNRREPAAVWAEIAEDSAVTDGMQWLASRLKRRSVSLNGLAEAYAAHLGLRGIDNKAIRRHFERAEPDIAFVEWVCQRLGFSESGLLSRALCDRADRETLTDDDLRSIWGLAAEELPPVTAMISGRATNSMLAGRTVQHRVLDDRGAMRRCYLAYADPESNGHFRAELLQAIMRLSRDEQDRFYSDIRHSTDLHALPKWLSEEQRMAISAWDETIASYRALEWSSKDE